MSKSMAFYHTIVAFGHFAGKPLRVTDYADDLTVDELKAMLSVLRKVTERCRREDHKEWPELLKLADQIDKQLKEAEKYGQLN